MKFHVKQDPKEKCHLPATDLAEFARNGQQNDMVF